MTTDKPMPVHDDDEVVEAATGRPVWNKDGITPEGNKIEKPKKLKKKLRKKLESLLGNATGITSQIEYVPNPDLWFGYFVITLDAEDIKDFKLKGLEPGQRVRFRIEDVLTDKIELV